MGDMTATDNYRVLLSGGEGEIVEKKVPLYLYDPQV